jgi:predicted DNA-binding protein (MmcQ/YjbR family)
MDLIAFRTYCLEKKGTSEDFPFDEVTLALRVGGKIFALTGLDAERFQVNLKCEPEYAVELREQYPEVQPGYHMNKKHWNTVDFEGSLPESLLRRLIDHSYEQTVKTLKKAERARLDADQ